MQNQLRPSINYVITVAMERQVAFTGPLVLTKQVQFSRMPEGPTNESLWQVAGIIHRKGAVAAPLAGVVVQLLELGRQVTSDGFGRFSFSGIAPGAFHLFAQVDDNKVERKILVPPSDTDLTHYDLIV
jgi:hypothetical protein